MFNMYADSDSSEEPLAKLERKVNAWLEANPGIEIVSRQVSTCGWSDNGIFKNCTIVIFFRRKV